jgi:hypothetical protein
MRVAALLLVLVPTLAACAAPTGDESVAEIPLAWRGTFAGSCLPGEVVILLEDREESTFRGTMYYETGDDRHLRVNYNVHAELEDGKLSLKQTDIDYADENTNTWCTGTYAFSVDPSAEEKELTGEYTPTNCGCGGTARLTAFD